MAGSPLRLHPLQLRSESDGMTACRAARSPQNFSELLRTKLLWPVPGESGQWHAYGMDPLEEARFPPGEPFTTQGDDMMSNDSKTVGSRRRFLLVSAATVAVV